VGEAPRQELESVGIAAVLVRRTAGIGHFALFANYLGVVAAENPVAEVGRTRFGHTPGLDSHRSRRNAYLVEFAAWEPEKSCYMDRSEQDVQTHLVGHTSSLGASNLLVEES
jgi:hypothetical protein